jgi:hypothetical protein
MNKETGEIKLFKKEEIDAILNRKDSAFIPISINDATEKQKKNMQVSKKDNRSKLGKLFKKERKKEKQLIAKRERIFRKNRK